VCCTALAHKAKALLSELSDMLSERTTLQNTVDEMQGASFSCN
jgi:hypothetical protein